MIPDDCNDTPLLGFWLSLLVYGMIIISFLYLCYVAYLVGSVFTQ